MGGLRATKVRQFIATIFVIALIVVMVACGTAAAGIDLPILGDIAAMFGIR